jgi:hypothetical protein
VEHRLEHERRAHRPRELRRPVERHLPIYTSQINKTARRELFFFTLKAAHTYTYRTRRDSPSKPGRADDGSKIKINRSFTM